MSEEQGYQGWKSYETWLVKLWIDNEQASQEYWLERARLCADSAEATEFSSAERVAVYELADLLQENHEDLAPQTSGVYADLLNASLSRVNWREIAEALIEDAKEIA